MDLERKKIFPIFFSIFSQKSDFLKKSQLFKRLLSLIGLKMFFFNCRLVLITYQIAPKNFKPHSLEFKT